MKLLEQYDEALRVKNYTIKTRKTYGVKFEQFIRWLRDDAGKWVHPETVGSEHITRWLTHMATKLNAAASSQDVALSAVLFYYRNMLGREIEGIDAVRSKKPKQLPVCVSSREFGLMLPHLRGDARLVAMLQFGSGLRIGEACSIRIKDIDLDECRLYIKGGKGQKDRTTLFDASIRDQLAEQIERMRLVHARDVREGNPGVSLPFNYGTKCPSARTDFRWYYLFCSDNISRDPDPPYGMWRHHKHDDPIGKQITNAAKLAGLTKKITSHALRHGFATELIRQKTDLQTIQKLMGHSDVATTMIYLHVELDDVRFESPLARILANPSPAATKNKVSA